MRPCRLRLCSSRLGPPWSAPPAEDLSPEPGQPAPGLGAPGGPRPACPRRSLRLHAAPAGHSGAGPGFPGEGSPGQGVPQPCIAPWPWAQRWGQAATGSRDCLTPCQGTGSLDGPDPTPSATWQPRPGLSWWGPPGRQGREPWGGRLGGFTWPLQEDKDSSRRGARPGDAARSRTRAGPGGTGAAVFPSSAWRLRRRARLILRAHGPGLCSASQAPPLWTAGGRSRPSAGCWDLCVTLHRSRPSITPEEADPPSVRGTGSP